MLRAPTLACGLLLLVSQPADSALITHVFAGRSIGGSLTFSGSLTYDTEAPSGLHTPPYDAAIGLDVAFSDDLTFGNTMVSHDDAFPFAVEVSDAGLLARVRFPPAATTTLGIALLDASGASFSTGVLPTSLSLEDLDDAFLFASVQRGTQRVDFLLPITSLRTVPEPGSAALLGLGLAWLARPRRRLG